MNLYTTILLEFILISSSILLLFKFRNKLGLAPLYILLGSVQYIQANLGSSFSFSFFGNYEIYPGSIILFSGILFAVLLIYIKEGSASARTLIIGIILSNVIMTLMFEITYLQKVIDSGVNNSSLHPDSVFKVNFKYFLFGTAILLLDFLLIAILYQFLISKIKKIPFAAILFISLWSVLIFDAVAFNFALFYGTPRFEISLISHLLGKSIAALIYSIVLYLYIKYIDIEKTKSATFIADQNRDIFSILKYKKRYEDLKVEKEETEQKLTSQLETTLNNSSDGFVTLDTNWCYTFINKNAARFLGKTPSSLIGKHIWTEFPEGVGLPFYKAYYKAVDTQKTIYFEDYYEPLGKWFENRIYPSPEGLTIYFTDITEQKLAKEKLINNEQLFRRLSSNAPVAIFQTDKEGACNFVNEEWVKYAGMSFKDAMGFGWANAIHSDDREKVLQEWQESIKTGSVFISEFRFQNKNDKITWLSAKAVGIYDTQNNLTGFIGMALDITERKQAGKKLVFANTELSKANAELNVLRDQLEQENIYLRNELDLVFNYEEMVYGSAEFSNVLSEIEKVAPTNATVLLLGESGTGKELLARAIQNTSLRNNKPLIKVNCSAIPRELIESELFGHKKGSFTGAFSDKIGKFELADGGTLFLDEIGELPLDMQPKILRFLQEGEIEVIGGTELKKLDVRVIAATNRNLKEEIEKKQFREDLYFRLNVFPIKVPALRNRKDDIPLLVEHFVDKFNKAYDKQIKYIPDGSMNLLKSYEWPGNVRELENLIERAAILSNDETLIIPGFESRTQKTKQPITNKDLSLNAAQRDHILKVLEQCSWKISGPKGASAFLDLKPSTLRDKMKKLGISKPAK